MVSRAQVAAFVASKMRTDRRAAVQAAAAWLVEGGRQNQAGYLARDVAQELAASGYVLARITTARPLGREAREHVERFIQHETGAKELELDLAVDPTLIGGVRIEIPGAELDATVRTKLAKFVEGVR